MDLGSAVGLGRKCSFGYLEPRRPTAKVIGVRDGGRGKTTRTTCTEMDRRHSDVVQSRRSTSNVDDREQRQLDEIRG